MSVLTEIVFFFFSFTDMFVCKWWYKCAFLCVNAVEVLLLQNAKRLTFVYMAARAVPENCVEKFGLDQRNDD